MGILMGTFCTLGCIEGSSYFHTPPGQRGFISSCKIQYCYVVRQTNHVKQLFKKRKVPLHFVWEEWTKWIEPLHGLYIPLVLPYIYCDLDLSLFLLCISFEKTFYACLDLHANNFSRQRLRQLSSQDSYSHRWEHTLRI